MWSTYDHTCRYIYLYLLFDTLGLKNEKEAGVYNVKKKRRHSIKVDNETFLNNLSASKKIFKFCFHNLLPDSKSFFWPQLTSRF